TEGKGVQIMSIDNLPTEMPLEASEYFGDALYPFIVQAVKGRFDHPVLKGATITTPDGKLAKQHEKLYEVIEEYGTAKDNSGIKVIGSQKVLLLGSGYVAAPLVDYLLRSKNVSVTIASNSPTEALNLSRGRAAAPSTSLDVNNPQSLGELINGHDVVVSFVPATFHPLVAEQCIQKEKHLVTASYISPAMKAFDERAKAKGLTFMNEVGLDPGIDHMTAMKLFDSVKAKGGEITSFISWCGGLPAPEASGNPLGYKFSWSPRGVLLAALNSAKYKMGGKLIDVPGKDLLRSAVPVSIYPGFSLEGLPNRDSMGYLDLYKLGNGEGLQDMFRGTLRYQGFSELMGAFNELGLLDTTEQSGLSQGVSWVRQFYDVNETYSELMAQLTKSKKTNSPSEWRSAVAAKLRPNPADSTGRLDRVMSALNWLEMLSPLNPVKSSPSVLDAFCALLQDKLVYGAHERDMVIMHHKFGIAWPDQTKEHHTSTLIAYGDEHGYSAMAKTVGLPAAIATEMILNGDINRHGVLAPVYADIYEPALAKLEAEGIRFEERVTRQ
ncbi:hypothetical protein HDU76_006052, partial [Blyttiomyces sp. JEL0837]